MYIISGKFKKQKLSSPKTELTRPSTSQLREAIFNIIQNYLEGGAFLDLFAGSGAIGFEALSRGVSSCCFVDSSREAIRCLRQNAKTLHVESQSTILHSSVFTALELLEKQNQQFDIIFADPPYGTHADFSEKDALLMSEKVIIEVDRRRLLKKGGILLIEEASSSEPNVNHLLTLTLKNSRRYGRTSLQMYTQHNSESDDNITMS